MAKNMPKIADIGIFAIFRPLRGIKTLQKQFYLVEEVLSFHLVAICENPLRIGFRNEYFTFTSQNEVDLDDLHILKIGFKIGLEISHSISHNFSHSISNNISDSIICKIFCSISCKIS